LASFLNVVCGGGGSKSNLDRSKEGGVKKAAIERSIISDVVRPLVRAEVLEKLSVTRILVAKTMLGEELSKSDPSPASLAVYRKAAFGTETPGGEEASATTTVEGTPKNCAEDTVVEILPKALSQTTTIEGLRDPVLFTDEPSEIELSDDAAISIGDSDNEEGISEDYSGTGSSSCGESMTSRGSRKRPADESPERETKEISRREFPGNVTRSEGWCRIYVQTTASVNATLAGQLNATATEIPAATNEGISDATVIEGAVAKAAKNPGVVV